MNNVLSPKLSSYVISTIFHGSILTLLFFIRIDWNVSVPEFIEIQFERGNNTQPIVQASDPSSGMQNTPEKLALPTQRALDIKDDILEIRDQSKIIPNEKVEIINNDHLDDKQFSGIKSSFMLDDKQIANVATDVKLSPDFVTNVGKIEAELPFKIEGRAAFRTLISSSNPKFPEGLQQEATVKIKFTVLPNGLIGNMIPIIKGNEVLERVALNTFKQWRFNALPANVPQVPEHGTITFRFLLK